MVFAFPSSDLHIFTITGLIGGMNPLVCAQCIQSNPHVNESKQVPEHRVSEAVNPRTGRRERVFVNLEAVYPDYSNPNHEISFEELRAMSRGWTDKNWRPPKRTLTQISGNVPCAEPENPDRPRKKLPEHFDQKISINDVSVHRDEIHNDDHGGNAGKSRKLKLREVKGETQTSKYCIH